MNPQPLDGGGVAGSGGFWFPMNKDHFVPQSQTVQNPNPLKRPRISDEYQQQPMNTYMTHPQNAPIIINNNNNNPRGTGRIFFKTRFCAKFKLGNCKNGESCNFAHGDADLRQPPPNWQELVSGGGGRVDDRANPLGDDDQKIIHRLKLCKKFYKGEECPYGERCNFIHKDPARLSDDPARPRESSAISIGITPPAAALEAPMVNGSSVAYRKTKLCTKFEITGQCPFGGACHFAHGVAELQVPEAEAGNAGSVVGRSQPVPCASPCVSASVPIVNEEGHGKRRLLNISGSKKLNGIYGDWLDDTV